MQDAFTEHALKVAPPATVMLTTWASGVHLSDIAYIVTIVYTLLMAANLIYTKIHDFSKPKSGD